MVGIRCRQSRAGGAQGPHPSLATALGLALAVALPALASEPEARYALQGQLRPSLASEDGRFLLQANARQTSPPDTIARPTVDAGSKAASAAGCGPGGLFADGFEAGAAAACWSSVGNSGLSASLHSVGTTDDMPFTLASNGQRSLWIEPRSAGAATITTNIGAGAWENLVGASARGVTISGGGAVAGSDPDHSNAGINRMLEHYGTVRGGATNRGVNNSGASPFSVIGGGRNHLARLGEAGAIGGGLDNEIFADRVSLLGGSNNRANGESGVVIGGGGNEAVGFFSTIDGGSQNCAGGDYSWAGGRGAKVRRRTADVFLCLNIDGVGEAGDRGSFVWADSQNENFVSNGENQFLARAAGSVQFTHDDNTTGNTVDWFRVRAPQGGFPLTVSSGSTIVLLTTGFAGVRIGSGSTVIPNPETFWATAGARRSDGQSLWDTTSDARVKHQIVPLQGAVDILLALRPVRYRYTPEYLAQQGDEDRDRLGFIAQELAAVWPTAVHVAPSAQEGAEPLLQVNPSDLYVLTTAATRELALRQRRQRQDLIELRADAIELLQRLDRLESQRLLPN